MYTKKQQGEVKAINASEPVVHHTSALTDRWNWEGVLFFLPTHTDEQSQNYTRIQEYTQQSEQRKEKKMKEGLGS